MAWSRTRVSCAMLGFTFALGFLFAAGHANAQEEGDLTELSLEDLLDVEVTSVSKKAQRRSEAAAAIFVISNDDIRRSGATHIAEVLRQVPGISVARLDSNKWSVTSRGFGGRFSNKLLVLVDGRSVYTPLFSGVYWEALDVPLDDVDRVEVIRGPGSTVWGANAVNGVINIVTKSAADTQGGLVSAGGGTELNALGRFRYGGAIGELGHYRIYGTFTRRDDFELLDGDKANDNWWIAQGGFRLDLNLTDDDLLTVQGDHSRNRLSEKLESAFLRPPRTRIFDNTVRLRASNLLTRWTHTLSDTSSVAVQLYYFHWDTEDEFSIQDDRDIFDFEFQHRFQVGDRHDIVWGGGYRHMVDDIVNSDQSIRFDPRGRTYRIYSGFIQDEISLIPDKLALSLGTKLEYHDFSGFEVQPSARLAWTPNERHTVWGAVSRAVRTPSRAEEDIFLPSIAFPRTLVALVGDDDFEAENLVSFELGYRVHPRDNFQADFALFYNIYDDFRSLQFRSPRIGFAPLPPHLLIPVAAGNKHEADTYGFEMALDWQPKPWWRSRLSYTFTEVDIDLNTFDIITGAQEGDTPEQRVFFWNSFDMPHNLELDVMVNYVDALPTLNVDDYVGLDVRLGWQVRDDLELSVVGQNLVQSSHQEFAPTFVNTVPSEVQRGVFGKITWRF